MGILYALLMLQQHAPQCMPDAQQGLADVCSALRWVSCRHGAVDLVVIVYTPCGTDCSHGAQCRMAVPFEYMNACSHGGVLHAWRRWIGVWVRAGDSGQPYSAG